MLITNNYWVALGLTIMTMITWGSNFKEIFSKDTVVTEALRNR